MFPSVFQGRSSQIRTSFNESLAQSLIILLLSFALIFSIIQLAARKSALKKWFSQDYLIHGWMFRQWRRERKFKTSTDSFVATFPPSPRDAIMSRTDRAAVGIQKVLQISRPLLSLLQSQFLSTSTQGFNPDGKYTPTGFSMAEIEALGSFPDYSVLSGVPHPKPCPEFDIKRAIFRPFRPFRWAYHQTMSLQKFEPDFWVELEQNYFGMLNQRKELYKEHGTSILNYSPGSELACRELMEMVLQYLCIRYPHCFSLTDSKTVFRNHLLDTCTDITSTHPLHVLFEHVPEDFAIMLRDETDGMYYLRAGFICSSIGWTFGTHFNRQLRDIHTEVNDYAEKMSKSMDRYFSKMPVDKPIQRGAWFVEDWEPLFVTPEEYKANKGTRRKGENVTIDQCNLRVDWQTLRRLPLSGAIVFNFKAIFTPMTELREEPYIPSLMYKQITDGKPSLTEEKVHDHIRPTVLGALQEWKSEQVRKGTIIANWKEETLQESPFYPGWEERWRSRVGFSI